MPGEEAACLGSLDSCFPERFHAASHRMLCPEEFRSHCRAGLVGLGLEAGPGFCPLPPASSVDPFPEPPTLCARLCSGPVVGVGGHGGALMPL